MKLQRLLEMSPAEIVYRSWQEATKSMERMTVKAGEINPQAPCVFEQLKTEPVLADILARKQAGDYDGAAGTLMEKFYHTAPQRFFGEVLDRDTTVCFARAAEGFSERIISTAQAVCEKRFSILGYGELFFGNPIRWNLDPVSGQQSALVHWSRINPLDPQTVGDSKVVWELSRHQWMIDLGQAWRLTGDEKYAQAFAGLLRAWMRANPPGLGINWTSSLEVAMRLISWCWALMLFHGSKSLTPRLFADMVAWAGTHASYIERYLSYYFSPNTHLTGEALGLYYAGILFPELEGADRWRRLGSQILEEQIGRQVYTDGVYFEQSTRYQYYTIEIYLHYLLLAQKNGDSTGALVRSRLEAMLDFLLLMQQPDGSMPQTGDTDGGWLMPFVRRAPTDHRALFAIAAVLFDRADYARVAGKPAPEAVWLLGKEGLNGWQLPRVPDLAASHLFPHGGYAIMRNHWGPDAHQMIFDTGPLGCSFSSGHGHADLLGIQCAVFGEPFLVDAGTFCYTADEKWRNHFRSTRAHNTIQIDGAGQAEPKGPFGWERKAKATLRRWQVTDDFVFADADHNAYQRLSDPVMHRRRILFWKKQYWIMVDDLDGNNTHRLDLTFQFSPREVRTGPESWVEAVGHQGHGLRLRTFSAGTLDSRICQGELEPPRGWISTDYGQQQAAPCLVYSTRCEFPLRIVTLLLPCQDLALPAPRVHQQIKGRSMYLDMNDGQILIITDHDIIVRATEH